MTTPSVTLRSIKNEDTGIDISVPRFKEEEAPLGGISVLYEIFVVTRLEIFKTRLHKSGDVVHFTIFKAYREIEDLYNKLNKRYPKAGLPPVPKASSKYTDDERVEALDLFFKAIAQNIEICHSSTFTHFIGINSHRLPSFTLPKTETTTDNCDKPNDVQNEEFDNSKKETVNEVEVFPKMKINAVEKVPSVQQPLKNVDLFEEVKHTKETTINTKSKGKFSQGLFDDFEEDDNLFSSIPGEKAPVPSQEEKVKESKEEIEVKKPEAPKRKEKVLPAPTVDDSEIIIKDRKPGDVSLFEDQDFGDYITKDEEALFLVTSPTTTQNKKNTLLFFEREESPEDIDKRKNENLDDLLDLAPLPNSLLTSKKLEKEPEQSIEKELSPLPAKPVPLPRKFFLGKVEFESQPKPEVKPRKVFLNKANESTEEQRQKPELPVRPPVPAKPTTVQTKPAPPPKPKPPPKKPKPNVQTTRNTTNDLDAANANEPGNLNTATEDLKELDILKYIEQEEKSLDAQLNLFD
ncbi:HCLS1-binding protein 3-like [Argiope bruennichi]|uniref:HCLS1-binding protein 3-like n=1 Tax=Argiope bruennichi TaxID=94029 RepID=UPI002493D33B|nr:HCLS1-binding protein 3-like [Argiope bruennichi]XP_055948062.1 HCLS1-binding protein 3-like [Argiope bruennichi]XP_055948064.1 HCLS1-binding protein 3-like [Argiope bruennichi]XP_055948065.1 HCLS1-binding protein 3-like [Argiope bruennichi]XP_055948066.1 HCLS1-binding protein 3-like [Argiope bruennichi]